MIFYFRPKPGRFGVQSENVGITPSLPITANVTTKYNVPLPYRKCAFLRLSAVVTNVPADADGTLLLRAVRYDSAATSDVTLSTDIDLEALTTRKQGFADAVSTLTDAQRTFKEGDSLQIHIVSNSAAIDTQPTLFAVNVELALLE